MTGLPAVGIPQSGDVQTAFDFSAIRSKRRGSYYVTTRLTVEQFERELAAAKRQNEAILAIYRSHGALGPSDVLRICEAAGKRWPIHSIRRAITTLTDDEVLVKLSVQKQGIYGKSEHLWALPNDGSSAA